MRVISPPAQHTEGTEDVVGALSARLTEVLAENHMLKLQPVRREVVHVQVPQYVDRPETMTELVNLRKQIDSMNRQRLAVVAASESSKPADARTTVIEKIVEKVVVRAPSWLIPALVASNLAMMTLGAVLGRYAGQS